MKVEANPRLGNPLHVFDNSTDILFVMKQITVKIPPVYNMVRRHNVS